MHVCKQMPVHIFELMHVCAGAFATSALEGTDGRGKWTPVPEDYCGAQDQSAAYVPLWACYPLQHMEPVQHQPIMDQPPTPSVS